MIKQAALFLTIFFSVILFSSSSPLKQKSFIDVTGGLISAIDIDDDVNFKTFTDLEREANITSGSGRSNTVQKTLPITNGPETDEVCNLSQKLKDEIASYSPIADQVFKTVLQGHFKGRTYNDLSFFVDEFGSRIAGSKNLENAIDFMIEKMIQDDLENVHGEEVPIPHWVR